MRRLVLLLLVTSVGATALAQRKPETPDGDPDRFAGLKARSIGPAGMSGRVAAVDVDPSDPDILYVGAATGGVWKSTNGGVTWAPLFDEQPVHAIGAVAVAPSNPSVIWVGTGEGNVRNSVSVGNGMYRSQDGGRTWRHMGLEKTERIHRIAVHPKNADIVFTCAPGQEWGENKERGVFKTEDGGRSWRQVLAVNEKTGCGDLEMDPSNPDRLFASTWEFRRWPWFFRSGGSGSGLYVTHDAGGSWRKLQEEDGLPKAPYGRIGLAIAPSNPETVYAMVEAQQSALVRSDDGGRRWRSVNSRPNVNPRPFYFGDITVDPQRPDRVYSIDFEIRVSDDGGKTFQTLPGATWAQLHGDYHALWIDPRNPEFMVAGNDGGIGISRDRGRTFRFAGNLPLAQFYHVAVDHETPYNVYGGLQDNGSWRGPSNVWRRGGGRNYDWLEVGGGDGFETLPHPKDATTGYSLWQGGNVMRWNIRTGEEKLVKPAPPADGAKLRFNWNAGLATDPFEPDVVYLGSQFVHKSSDRGESWTIVSPDLTSNNPEWQKSDESGGITPDVTAAENFTTIVSIAPSPKERGLIWIGSDDGRIHVTRDGGESWTSVEKNVPGVPANTWVPHIDPSPHDPGTAFAVFDNHRRSDWKVYAYRTDDYGRTWRAIAPPEGVVNGYALVLRQDPVERNLLFLGTEFGLYFSPDGGKRWTHLKKTLPTASVMDLAIHPRDHDLVIATHGRALWILDDIRPLRAMSEAALKEPLKLYPIGDAQQHWSRAEEGGFGFGASEFRGAARPYGAILTYSMNLPGLPLPDEEKERARKEKEREASLREAEARPKIERPEKSETPRVSEAAPVGSPKKAEKPEEQRPRVDMTVADASGKIIRRFRAPAVLGVNRANWDLTSDAFKQPPRPDDAPTAPEDPSGPEVPPGTYTVTMKYETHQATGTVRVLPDPRSKNTQQDWQRRWDGITRVGALNDTAVDAIWRIRRTRQDVSTIQEKLRQRARDAGERDTKKIDEQPTIAAGTKLVGKLNELEKRLWVSPETVGIVPDVDVYSLATRAGWSLMSSWDPPNANQMEYMRQGEAKLRAFVDELNRFFAADVAEFRKQAAEVSLLGDLQPLTIK